MLVRQHTQLELRTISLIIIAICAWYVDHFRNRRASWIFGLLLIVLGNILFGVAESFTVLLLSRLFQGAASAILYTVGLAVLVESVKKDEVGRYMGSAMSCNNFGIILSPLLGGILYKAAGKKAVLGVMVGLSGIDITLRLIMQERKTQTSNSPSDNLKQDQQISATEKGLQTDIDEKQVEKLEHNTSSSSLASHSSQILPIPPVPHGERHTESIVIKQHVLTYTRDSTQISKPSTSRFVGVLKLIQSPRFLTALYGCFINECIVASLCAVLPIFVFDTFHWKSLESGCLFLTIAIPGLAGPLAGILGDKFGPRPVALVGFILTTPSLIFFQFVQKNSIEQISLFCVLLTLAGRLSSLISSSY